SKWTMLWIDVRCNPSSVGAAKPASPASPSATPTMRHSVLGMVSSLLRATRMNATAAYWTEKLRLPADTPSRKTSTWYAPRARHEGEDQREKGRHTGRQFFASSLRQACAGGLFERI